MLAALHEPVPLQLLTPKHCTLPAAVEVPCAKAEVIGTEAMATVTMHVFKLIAYHQTSLLTLPTIVVGLALGPVMILGSWIGKQLIQRISNRVFVVLVEITLVVAGLNFLIKG